MAELQVHHIIPEAAFVDLWREYRQRFGGTEAAARDWANSIIRSAINQIPLPASADAGIALPHHNGRTLVNSYETPIKDRVRDMVRNAASPGQLTSDLLDLSGAMRIGLIEGLLGPSGSTWNGANNLFLTDANLQSVISDYRTQINAFRDIAADVSNGTVSPWAAYAMGLKPQQLQELLTNIRPDVGDRGRMLAGIAAAAEARGLPAPSGHTWDSFRAHVNAPNVRVGTAVSLFQRAGLSVILVGAMAVPIDALARQIVERDHVSYPDALRQLGLDPTTIDIPALVGSVAVDFLVPGGAVRRLVELISNVDDIIAVADLYAAAYPDDRNIRAFVEFLQVVKNDPRYAAASDFINAARARAGELFSDISDAVFGGSRVRKDPIPKPLDFNAAAIGTRVYLSGYYGPRGDEIVIYGTPGQIGPLSFEPFDGDPLTYDGVLLPANVQVTGSGTSIYDLTFTVNGQVARPIFADLRADGVPARYGAEAGAALQNVVKPPFAYAIDLGGGRVEVHWALGPNAGKVQIIEGDIDAVVADLTQTVEGRQSGFSLGLSSIPFGQLGSIFGSNLAKLVNTNNPWEALGVGTALGTIGLNVGQGIDNALDASAATTFRNAFDDFGQELGSAGIGAIGSYLFAEWVNDQGLSDFGAGAVDGTAGAAIGQVADNLLRLGQAFTFQTGPNSFVYTNFQGQFINAQGAVVTEVSQAAPYVQGGAAPPGGARTWSTGLTNPNIYLNAVGSFLGTYLASKLVQFDTIGGQIGASLGSAIGGVVGAIAAKGLGVALNILLPGIGAFLGYIVGGLIGSLFGGTPKAGAVLDWNESRQEFGVGRVWSKHGGSKDAARSFASQVGELLNGVIAASGSRVADASGIDAGAYEQKGKKYWYKPGAAAPVTFTTSDAARLVNHGAFIALSDLSERLVGGDVYIKRALSATLAQSGGNASAAGYAAGEFEAPTLFGNIATAQDYPRYLQKSVNDNHENWRAA